MKTKKIKFNLAVILLFITLSTFTACSDDDSCGKSLISFNNKTSSTIYIRVPGETNGYESVSPGSSITIGSLVAGQSYPYTITSGPQGTGDLLLSGSEVAEDCVSLGIDIN